MDKFEEKTLVFFAKEFNFSFEYLKSLAEFLESLRDFSHHLSENHYYSENINRKVMSLNLESHLIALELKNLEAQASKFYAEVHKQFLAGKKPSIDKKSFSTFANQVDSCNGKVYSLCVGLQELVMQIKKEQGEKL